jgi:hypothetical protein
MTRLLVTNIIPDIKDYDRWNPVLLAAKVGSAGIHTVNAMHQRDVRFSAVLSSLPRLFILEIFYGRYNSTIFNLTSEQDNGEQA